MLLLTFWKDFDLMKYLPGVHHNRVKIKRSSKYWPFMQIMFAKLTLIYWKKINNEVKTYRKQEQKMKFSLKYFFSTCGQIYNYLPIWSHLRKKSLMENFFFMQWRVAAEWTCFSYDLEKNGVKLCCKLLKLVRNCWQSAAF